MKINRNYRVIAKNAEKCPIVRFLHTRRELYKCTHLRSSPLTIYTSTINNSSSIDTFYQTFRICHVQLGEHRHQVSFISKQVHFSFIPGKISVSYFIYVILGSSTIATKNLSRFILEMTEI